VTDDQAVFEQRANELAAKAGITLDREECPPEWSDFMDAARSDVLLQRGIARVRTKGLPEELCDYLARTWMTHVETFERCRSEPDVTMAASWARRHAKVAAAVLAMPPLSGVSSQDTPQAPRPARVWRDTAGDLWCEHHEDEPVLVKLLEFRGKPADPHNSPVLLADVVEQWGPMVEVLPGVVSDTDGGPR
jgi:hypothetical protein